MKRTFLFVLLLFCTTFIFAQIEVWQWAKQAGGTYWDEGCDIAIDSSGNCYVTGYFQSTATFGSINLASNGGSDIFVAKLDSSGNWLWTKQAGGTYWDEGWDIAIDPSGNSYVTGYFEGTASFGTTTLTSSGQDDIFVAKLDSNGNWLWAKQAGGNYWDMGYSIAIDSSGNCYVTGYFQSTATFGSINLASNGGSDIFVAKLDSSGNWFWAQKAGGAIFDYGRGIATDSSGNCYVTGYFSGSATIGSTTFTGIGSNDIFIAKLNSNGAWQWSKQAGGTNYDGGYSIAIDSSGNSYVTGYFYSVTASFGTTTLTSNGESDIFVAKLDSNGNWLWTKQAGGTINDEGYGIAIDSSGNCYVTGYFQSTATFGSINLASNGGSDIFVAKLDSSGNWLWAQKAGGNYWDMGYSIAIDSSGNTYLTGNFIGTASFGGINLTSSGGEDIFVAKAYIPYDSNDIVVVEGNTGLGAIYPNPFNPVANIPYNLSEISDADFYIYNVKGQLVRHINVGPQHPGYYQISWNGKDDNDKSCSSGIYYFIMKAGKQTFQRKAVLMK
jgi:hypothetical protein